MAVLNNNPEVLLKKRKNADRKRIEKSEQLRVEAEKKKKQSLVQKDKFLRAEKLAMKNKAAFIEKKRMDSILKHEQRQISQKKEEDPKLMFIIRIPNINKHLTIPEKAKAVLQVLRLTEENMGVFVNVTPTVLPVLKLIAPYIVVGKPSLASVRELFQKRASFPNPESESGFSKLDNNQVVEDTFGEDLGFICVEDLVHEIYSLGENFKTVNNWIAPFKLVAPVNGWSPKARLERIQYEREMKKPITLAGHVSLEEIDIDKHIGELN
ncbi:hypothetical protein FT663_01031 [Candidozyma haemuli var. vulneris]|uniref:Large ribosomal subunit protein uL30-like ferredoxin-like fold domain-containing protein n=1 Tax=Candidozyma haemuli TaxID=45357 RepID=A0A2V1AU16_9ASCO|nr:hypothetical protein CXQ85_000234 [[Candida] haemuloni]KAF3990253.1 hypothetical protein FT662_02347 [[Candida] haemuloni var. vulneris]KAF3994801.1 hypothetical protein FT663_01031 [[Candida] haemuloni var. vulneris]PVH21262.1 hypothetical protein CXQ85_000234 [[Candida] haemuloni]